MLRNADGTDSCVIRPSCAQHDPNCNYVPKFGSPPEAPPDVLTRGQVSLSNLQPWFSPEEFKNFEIINSKNLKTLRLREIVKLHLLISD
jgi:hypothetical protein